MSTDYDASLYIGYVIPVEDFFKNLMKHTPEKSHMVPRFDPETGKKVTPVKVIDAHEAFDIVFCGQTFLGPEVKYYDEEGFQPEEDVIEALEEALDCTVTMDGYYGERQFVCLS